MFRVIAFAVVAAAAYADVQESRPEIDALFAEWDTETSPGCSIAIAKDGELWYSQGYGLAELEHGSPITPATIFHVASVSKQFTAFALMLLEADGALSLEDDIREYLPELADFGAPVRIRHLIHHTSGIRDQWELLVMAGWRFDDVITMDDIWEMALGQRELNFLPGEQYMYCNMGYTLLAFIVERVSGRSFPEFCKARIFDPLEMTNTHFHDDHTHIVPKRAYSYHRQGEGYRHAVLSYANAGATSLFTTPEDLLKWLENFYTAEIGGNDVIEKMMSPGVFNSGMPQTYAGGVSAGPYKGLASISHSGGDAGFRSFVVTFPEHHVSIAVTSNLGSFSAPGKALEIADVLLKEHLVETDEERETIEIDDDVVRAVRGVYVNPRTGAQQTVASRGGRLQLANPGAPPFTLAHDGGYDFVTAEYSEHLRFRFYPSASGDAEKVDVVSPESPMATYVRMQPRPAHVFYPLQFVGDYYSPELDVTWRIVLDENADLALKRRKYGTNKLQSSFTDGFASGMFRLYFTRDADGRVNGLRVSSGRVTGLKFVRVK